MTTQDMKNMTISIHQALKLVSVLCGVLASLLVLDAVVGGWCVKVN